jgi:hypothetical protein
MEFTIKVTLDSNMTEDEALEWVSEWLNECTHIATEHLVEAETIKVENVTTSA